MYLRNVGNYLQDPSRHNPEDQNRLGGERAFLLRTREVLSANLGWGKIILTGIFRDFCQSIQKNSGIITSNGPQFIL
jgi:hypothetical protein